MSHPTAEWIARQITEALPWDEAPRYLIRDQDAIYGTTVARRLRAMGIRDKPIAPGSPWQNGYAERLIGTIRRECLDHLIVLGEAHLRWILGEFVAYYNKSRTHRALSQDAPVHRAIERLGAITSRPVLGGLITNIAESSFRHAQRSDSFQFWQFSTSSTSASSDRLVWGRPQVEGRHILSIVLRALLVI
jgi:hypothetical protein